MKASLPALPTCPAPFPAAFVTLLHGVLASPVPLHGGRDDRTRARRQQLGHSGTFVGHRAYSPGDDLRQLDWAAYARSGELVCKQLADEDRRTAALLLDVSPSLLVGAPPRRLHALRLAALLGGLALVHLDGLTVIVPGAGSDAVTTWSGLGALPALLRHLERLPVVVPPADHAVELVLARGVPGRVHWISDFAEPRAFERPLRALRRRGARVIGWLPELPGDHEPPAGGYLRVVDPETGADLLVPVDAAFAKALREQLAQLARQQDRLFASAGAWLQRWTVPAGAELTVAPYRDIAGRSVLWTR